VTEPEQALRQALDDLPGTATVWWRDDDAGRDHPRLHRLLALAHARQVEPALAVVPAWLESRTVDAITACPGTTVLQHGIAHADHARAGEKKVELGGRVTPADLQADLLAGTQCLRDAFPVAFLPVLVPPWNRIAPGFVAELPAWGFAGLSRFGRATVQSPDLREINTQVDLILWREGRRAMGLPELTAAMIAALRSAAGEPVGILSHHLAMDEDAFLMLDRVLAVLQDHPSARVVGIGALLREAG
jgi:hypothetical protein